MSISPDPGRLFEVEEIGTPVVTASHLTTAVGGAAQFEAVARLLRLGHKVAIPVVDDDGVDLVVNYRTTVQVKHTNRKKQGRPHHHVWLEQSNSYHRRSGLARRSAVRPHVDVFLIHVEGGVWYVIPREAMPLKALVLGDRVQQWREAWELFDR